MRVENMTDREIVAACAVDFRRKAQEAYDAYQSTGMTRYDNAYHKFPLSMTSLSWPPAIRWTCTRSQTENRRLTMAEYHVGCGAFAIYAGTLNSRNKNLWQNKTECTDEAICAVRDYIVQECLGGLNCEKATSGGYEWTLKDGRVVELRVTVKDGGKQANG